jgi:hypothetical protein
MFEELRKCTFIREYTEKLFKKLFFVGTDERYGSEDPDPHPDPHQNVKDPEHCPQFCC